MKKPPDVERLIAELGSADALHRDAAIVRLRLAGSRAVPRLRAFLGSPSPPSARAAALSALEGADDPSVVDSALSALDETDADVVVAGLGVLRGWVARDDGARVLDAIARIALDPGRADRVRQAALDALSELPRELVQPLLDQVPPPDPRMAADDPARLRAWLAAEGAASPLPALHDAIVRARACEQAEPLERVRQEWQSVRAAVHATLASRGSSVALYDLRETFEAAPGPLPLDFLVAAAGVGDATCLEPMARAWERAEGETWWRARLSAAAAEIVERTGISRRSAAIKRIRAKWIGFL